jgi:hypothetical protein
MIYEKINLIFNSLNKNNKCKLVNKEKRWASVVSVPCNPSIIPHKSAFVRVNSSLDALSYK